MAEHRFFSYESRQEPVLSRSAFALLLLRSLGAALALVGATTLSTRDPEGPKDGAREA